MLPPERPGRGWVNPRKPVAPAPEPPTPPIEPPRHAVNTAIHEKLLADLDTRRLEEIKPEYRATAVGAAVRTVAREVAPDVAGFALDRLVDGVVDEVLGLGPIQPFINDPTISEIMVNAPDQVFIERDGLLIETSARFRDADHIHRVIDRIVSSMGRRVDETTPMTDARLDDGSRVNVTLPPISVHSPTITIRKFRQDRLGMPDLVKLGTLSEPLAAFLEQCVIGRINIVVSGGTGSGKTTLLNSLSAFIPVDERIVTIEDTAELQLQRDHVVGLETRPANMEGTGEITARDLVRNALRMRPDRIIVGEARGSEAFDMLQAMNTGHEGSLTTIHANSPRDALARIENMVLMAGLDLPSRVIREQTASAIHLVVQLTRFPDGSRRVTEVSEVTGMEGDVIGMQDLYRFERRGFDADNRILGEHLPTGIRPAFADRVAPGRTNLPPAMFLRDWGW